LKEAFVSYAHEDKVLAGRVKQILTANGVAAFLAHEDLEVSAQWRDEILQHLDTSSALVAIVTENFSKSVWANQEVGIAIGKKLTLIPLLSGSSQSMKGFLETYQAVTVTDNNLDTVVKGLVPRINEGISSTERNVLKDLKIVLGRLMTRWQTYLALPSNERWTQPAIDEIQDTIGEEREVLLRIIAEGTGMDAGAMHQTDVIVSQTYRFILYRFDVAQLLTNNPFSAVLPRFQELEHRGNEAFETARALHTWLIQTQKF